MQNDEPAPFRDYKTKVRKRLAKVQSNQNQSCRRTQSLNEGHSEGTDVKLRVRLRAKEEAVFLS